MTEQATTAASTAAATVTSAASGVAENVFSMFGGGPKKEKVEDEDRGENSGSAKAQKEKDAEENPEVGGNHNNNLIMLGILLTHIYRMRPLNPRMFTSSLLSVSLRKLRSRPTKSSRNRLSRCAPSFSSLFVRQTSRKSVELVMLDFSSTRKMARLDWLCAETRL